MERLGMIVDISHVSDEAFWDVMEIAQKPVIASHSSCRALCDHPRNLSDDMIRAIAENGGVIGINFYPEFIEPKWGVDMVIGHEAAKARLREDAALLKRGALESLPMGYLLCGPVGTGKSFLAQCITGEIGIPCVMLKNFRSKYVGETDPP